MKKFVAILCVCAIAVQAYPAAEEPTTEAEPIHSISLENIAAIATQAIEKVNTTVSEIADILDDGVDMISGKVEEVRDMLQPLAMQMYAPILFMDLDNVINTVEGMTQEVENGVDFMVQDFNSRMNDNFNEIYSRAECQTDEQQFEGVVSSCIVNMETTLDNLKNSAKTAQQEVSSDVSHIVRLINECRSKANPILKAKCAAMSVKNVVKAAEEIQNDLEKVSQTISSNIQELSINFEACIPECQ